MALSERLLEFLFKWDARIYADMAIKGYEQLGTWSYAFFPGWPKFLEAVATLFSIEDARMLTAAAIVANFVFIAVSLHLWMRILHKLAPEIQIQKFVWIFLLYPTSVFFLTTYPEAAFVFLVTICTYGTIFQESRNWLYITLPILIFSKHAGISLSLAFPLWLSLTERRFHWPSFLSWTVGIGAVLLFYQQLSGNALSWLEAQKAWGRVWNGPWAIWMDLHGKGVEFIIYVFWLFAAPIWLLKKSGGIKTLLKGGGSWGLMFLITSSVYVPLWFGSSTASIYRIIFLCTPALILPIVWHSSLKSRYIRIGLLAFLVLLNLHATYRYVVGLHLA